MQSLDTDDARLRKAGEGDVVLCFRWANDPEVRDNSFSAKPITFESHKRWFAKKLSSPTTHIYILEYHGKPAGQIRFDVTKLGAEIDYSVAKDYRGKGLGSYLLRKGLALFTSEVLSPIKIVGIVADSNLASAKAFTRAGFVVLEKKQVNGVACTVYHWPR